EELGKQLKPLERQAQAAQRAATVQADLRDARLKLAGDRVVRVRAEFADAQRQAEVLEEQVALATEALEEATGQQMELEEQLGEIVPQAEAAQKLCFDLAKLVERLAATSRIAQERANNAGAVTAYQGQDPDDLEARARVADEEHAELVLAGEEAAEALESIREEVAERREAFTAADKEHAAQLRAIDDRREGVVRLIAQEAELSRQVETSEQSLSHSQDGVNEAAKKLRAAREEAAEVEKTIADF